MLVHFASLGGVLHLIAQYAGGVLSAIAHHVSIFAVSDTPIAPK